MRVICSCISALFVAVGATEEVVTLLTELFTDATEERELTREEVVDDVEVVELDSLLSEELEEELSEFRSSSLSIRIIMPPASTVGRSEPNTWTCSPT